MWCKHVLLLAVACVITTSGKSMKIGRPHDINVKYQNNINSPWMLIPDDNGKLHLAILNEISSSITRDVAEDVQLLLYTKSNGGSTPYRLEVNNVDNLRGSGYNPNNPTKILIHGFSSNGGSSVIINSKNAYLLKGEYNVIGVDWGVLCPSPNYVDACKNAVLVGQHLADLVEFLVAEVGAKLQDFHVVGHSLGGQVAGFAGNNTKTGKVGRITGLDTAYPMFGNAEPAGHLDSGDAVLVDAIHTCGGSLGFREPYATVDFYPNGGLRPQPGCGDDVTGSCSHARSVQYFIESIEQEDAFPAVQCLSIEEAESGDCTGGSTGKMGEGISFGNPGMYYTDTTK